MLLKKPIANWFIMSSPSVFVLPPLILHVLPRYCLTLSEENTMSDALALLNEVQQRNQHLGKITFIFLYCLAVRETLH